MAWGRGAAEQLARMLELVAGQPVPVRLRAWDGSEHGPPDAPLVVVHGPRAVRRVVRHPGELSLGRAYVAGEIDLDGDLLEGIAALASIGQQIGRQPQLGLAERAQLLAGAFRVRAVGPEPAPPAEEITLAGDKHSKSRDRAAVSSHYDVGNDFYRLLLGPSMVYSCGYWAQESSDTYTVTEAQRDKLDLVCRKLGLDAGMRVLDVGCGWGTFALHAAQRYGVRVVGITLSHEQVELARKRVAEAGLEDRVEIRLQDWRDVADQPFDAISSIGMAEHVGEEMFAEYAGALFALLRPGGRLLNHQIARHPGPVPEQRTFTDAYVFPDGALLTLDTVVGRLEEAGFEVRDVHCLREHYSRTLRAWLANLEAHWDECAALTSLARARIWRLYLALSAVGFDRGLLRVNQTLAVRPGPMGESGMPTVRPS